MSKKYSHVTEENFARIMILYHGLDYKKRLSFPDDFVHYELIFTVPRLSKLPILTFLNPDSPLQLIDTEVPQKRALLFHHQFVDYIYDYEQRIFDYHKAEPFYFYVTEINGDLILKLNPMQMCDFFQNTRGMLPCSFCFRNDMVQRFKNITAKKLVDLIWTEEQKRDQCQTLMKIDEISIVTSTYKTDDEYAQEVSELVSGLKPRIRSDLRVVVGSHEGKTKNTFECLKKAGVTVFAFPVESLDDEIRQSQMKNRKGFVKTNEILKHIQEAIQVFGPDGVIVRLVAGMGDKLNQNFEYKIKTIADYSNQPPFFNINQYMPFTHYHWRLFQTHRPYDLEYISKYCGIINKYVPEVRQIKFKISP